MIRYKLKRKHKRTSEELKLLQSLPLETKILYAQEKIKEWYEYWNGNVYVSFSGGKDSTVLLHLVRQIYPDVPAVFSDTGLEWPEIRDFVKTIDNVVWVKPKKNFKQVIEEYGYPVISKEISLRVRKIRHNPNSNISKYHLTGWNKGVFKKRAKLAEKWHKLLTAPFKISEYCCDWIKKKPLYIYEKQTKQKPMIGTMTDDSGVRLGQWKEYGCNSFGLNKPQSKPLSIFTEKDIWNYINKNNIPYAEIYKKGIERTGCMFCMFGIHMEKNNRFHLMKKIHPNIHKYCMENLGIQEVLDYLEIPSTLPKRLKLKRKKPKRISLRSK